jgi:hypothetical protein
MRPGPTEYRHGFGESPEILGSLSVAQVEGLVAPLSDEARVKLLDPNQKGVQTCRTKDYCRLRRVGGPAFEAWEAGCLGAANWTAKG